jgi:alkanesulfonate monooxygenase SsuD/methylene tetrahydromethanopterin reductase-like flavin-dependent oxidoreductase (luciferase family)
MNNVGGGVETVRRKEAILLEHCAAVGRDPTEIERTTGIGTVFIRDDRAEAERLFREAFDRNRVARHWTNQPVGTPEDVAEMLAPYLEIGYRHLIAVRRRTTRIHDALRHRVKPSWAR